MSLVALQIIHLSRSLKNSIKASDTPRGYHRSAPYQITREQADALFEEVLSAVNIILIELQRVVFVESLGTSAKVCLSRRISNLA